MNDIQLKLTKIYDEFFNSEKAGGLILVFVTVISLVLANSPWQMGYTQFWKIDLGGHTLVHWINDGLMAIFFLLIGLELEREIYVGELSSIKKATLPIFAAIGGMIAPAAIYLAFNSGTNMQSGTGIPTATDIAFAIGILSLLGNRVPVSLKIFLTALAVIDDLGAIIIISIFYTHSLSLGYLFLALAVFVVLLLLNWLKVRNLIPYLIGGVIMWVFMANSGVHATITGVLLAFAIPFRKYGEKSPSYLLQHFLHKPVAFIILPLFAMANTSIAIGSEWHQGLVQTNGLGIMLGLFIGKPVGIMVLSLIAVALGFADLPSEIKWKHILGTGFLAGIGFTMSIFIALLAFDSEEVITQSKIAILVASVISGIIGFFWLKFSLKRIDS